MQSTKLKKILAAGGALAVLSVAAVGVTVVQAQTAPTPSTQQNLRDKYTAALANRLNVTVDQLKQAMTDARKDVGLPDPGTRPTPGPGVRRGPGPGGFPGFAGRPGPQAFGGFLGKEADAVAALFKEDRAALIAELPGKTLEDLAKAHGLVAQDVINTITTTANAQIDQMAQTKNIPADRVSQMKQRISDRVQEFVTTHRFPARGTGTRS